MKQKKQGVLLKETRKSKRFEVSLECSIPDEVYARMEEELTVGK